MTELRTTHRLTVTEDMIDHLGHMNVRFYGVAARDAGDAVVADLGGADHLFVEPIDVYTRHFREQHLGAELEVRSGVLGGGPGWLRLYHELGNVETGDLAASFVHRLEPRDADPGTWPPPVEATGEIPERGRPRSIPVDTDPVAAAPTLDEVRADEGLAWRRPRPVDAAECDGDGTYDPGNGPMLVWGGEPLEGSAGPALHPGPDGQLIGWAAMEHRIVFRRLPRAGDQVQAFASTLEVTDKITHRLLWAYDVDRDDLLMTLQVVDVALDTVSRRAVPIPDDLRRQVEARLRPQYAPR